MVVLAVVGVAGGAVCFTTWTSSSSSSSSGASLLGLVVGSSLGGGELACSSSGVGVGALSVSVSERLCVVLAGFLCLGVRAIVVVLVCVRPSVLLLVVLLVSLFGRDGVGGVSSVCGLGRCSEGTMVAGGGSGIGVLW